nr:CPBP family intramembrane glutamic endopeptidase [Jonesia quinghaiensis]
MSRRDRLIIGAEIWILLGLSLGRSGVYALVNIIARLTDSTPLAQQTTAINASQSTRPYLDLTYQVLSLVFALVPVALALYLLSARGRSVVRSLGMDGSRPMRDFGWGMGLAAVIGIPGLAFYVLGRQLGITVGVEAAGLDPTWWAIPILILAALKNGVLEEIIVVGYLWERLRDLGWGTWRIIWTSALVRGSYHLYQGIGPFIGNVVMGVLFAWFYQSRWGRNRVWPLVIAHTVIDIVAFVGYLALPDAWLSALGVSVR